jgi:hypothetical protein
MESKYFEYLLTVENFPQQKYALELKRKCQFLYYLTFCRRYSGISDWLGIRLFNDKDSRSQFM